MRKMPSKRLKLSDLEEKFISELRGQLAKRKGILTTEALAVKAGLKDKTTISHILAGRRRISAAEMLRINEVLREHLTETETPQEMGGVDVVGVVGGLEWTETEWVRGRVRVEGVSNEHFDVSEQIGFEVALDSTDGRFRAGDRVIVVKMPNVLRQNGKAAAGDVVLVRYERKDAPKLYRDTLKRAEYRDDGLILVPVFDNTPEPTSVKAERIIGLVIGLRAKFI